MFGAEKPDIQRPSGNPCVPSPCGPNSQCRVVGNTPACSCLTNYVGRPPNCRPECTINAECPGHLACLKEKCTDPCPGSCGAHATCTVVKHAPQCACEPGYTGDPFAGCTQIQQSKENFNIFNKFHTNPNLVIGEIKYYKIFVLLLQFHRPKVQKCLAIHHRAVQMLYVKNVMVQALASVCQNISATHTLAADLSVLSTRIVIEARHV